MEKTAPPAAAPSPPSLKPLSPQEWETLIDDYQYGPPRLERWISSNYTGLPLLELSLSSLLRRDLPLNLKLHLLVFLEEHSFSFFETPTQHSLTLLLETLRSLIQAPPVDNMVATYSLKEQLMVSTTSIFVTCTIDLDGSLNSEYLRQLESLIELLLSIINRPNHGIDRQTRGMACECLRELEIACPCLLSEIAGHLWGLCQSERTHCAQSYVLLFASVIQGIMMRKPDVSILNTWIPMIPFNIPRFLIDENGAGDGADGFLEKEISESSYKELRRAMAFLLEWPQYLTPCGLTVFMSMIIPVAVALELQASLLKVQFSGLLYTYDPLLCHAFLGMYLRFLDTFEGQESEIAHRLVLISREAQHYLVFRLLALHWLLGFVILLSKRQMGKKNAMVEMSLSFYPSLFDPLALKALKLDLLAYCSMLRYDSRLGNSNAVLGSEVGTGGSAVKLFEDGLVSVSAFKWLPPWSTETAVAFRTFHKFLIGASSHSDTDSSSTRILMESTIFHALQFLAHELYVFSLFEYNVDVRHEVKAKSLPAEARVEHEVNPITSIKLHPDYLSQGYPAAQPCDNFLKLGQLPFSVVTTYNEEHSVQRPKTQSWYSATSCYAEAIKLWNLNYLLYHFASNWFQSKSFA
ncbi:unnamed protein product [Ilex paraguariensis]|uniref:AP5B1 middle domain-containing protein n=1 Tax=Ilex paraguariensis TaxID=185542 RepID=A0ABC8R0N1_9AQUA